MTNEVIIEEYKAFDASIQIPTLPITTQVLDIGTISAQLSNQTEYIRIRAKGSGFWWITGNASVSAAANTDGNTFIEAGTFTDHNVGANSSKYIDTAADA
jgi:hypothetical protein